MVGTDEIKAPKPSFFKRVWWFFEILNVRLRFIFLMVLAVIFIIWAAFNYLRAGGEPEKVKEAGNQLIYAAVAVAVALFARGFPLLVGGFLSGGGAGFDISQYGC